MQMTVTTTIVTTIDVSTLTPSHVVDIEVSDEGLPVELIYAAVEGGCKATINSIKSKQVTHVEDTEPEASTDE